MFCKLIFSLLTLTTLLIIGISCDSEPQVVARPGTEAHMELTKPSITKWAWEVITSTYTYLTPNLTNNPDGSYTLETFYSYTAKNEWKYYKDTITIDPKTYGKVVIKEAPEIEIR